MNLVEKYNTWTKNLVPFKDSRVFIWLGPAGLGDKITCLPAFRHLKKMYPDKKVVLYVEPLMTDLWKYCKYIDFVIPEFYIKSPDALGITTTDLAIRAWWSFYEHHQQHICKSGIIYICNTDYTDDIPLEYEISILAEDLPKIEEYKNEILDAAKGKKIVAIAPAYTMYSRMWSVESWTKLTQMLQDDGCFVVSLGGNNDLKVPNVDMEKCGLIPIRMVPHVLNIFDCLFTLNSGMLHLGSVNQDVRIIYISVGQFPPELIAPYRKGKLFHNMDVIDHSCAIKADCFKSHIEETKIRPAMNTFLATYQKETGTKFPDENIELMKKYVCWHYCAKVMDKYSCSKLITPEKVYQIYKKG